MALIKIRSMQQATAWRFCLRTDRSKKTGDQRCCSLMPCNVGRIGKIAQSDPENAKVLEDVLNDSVNWLTGLTKGCLYKEATEHEKEYALEYQAAALSKKPLLCITGSLDICTPKKIIYSLY